jgi:hypothetical protein
MAQHGRYTVVRKLANGGMAEIFLANQQGHEGFQKPVVLKRILGSISADPQFRNMLIDEAHISMGLTHSNIVQVLDLGLAGGRYFLVLELIDGWDLGHVLHRAKLANWPLPPPLGIFVVAEVCRALAYAHARQTADGRPLGIVHRDISPNNVLISEHGEVKLTDFGIAKAMNKREQTGMGVVKGKVAFMSPEQALGKPIDARSDLFSLGTLLYVVTAGVKPFDGPTDLETLLRVQRAEFRPMSEIQSNLPADVVGVIEKAMRLEPEDRYASADEMLVDLERALRSDYGGVGQTELKQYLAELQRRDGVPSIARAPHFIESTEGPSRDQAGDPGGDHTSGPRLLEGNAVVLGDAQEAAIAAIDEKTELAELVAAGGGGPQRLARRSPVDFHGATDLESVLGGVDGGAMGRSSRRTEVFGREQTPARTSRRVVEELSMTDGAGDDAPPVRFRRRKSRALPLLLVLGAATGAGFAAVHYFGWPPALHGLLPGSAEHQVVSTAGNPLSPNSPNSPVSPISPPGAAAPEMPRSVAAAPHVQEPAVDPAVQHPAPGGDVAADVNPGKAAPANPAPASSEAAGAPAPTPSPPEPVGAADAPAHDLPAHSPASSPTSSSGPGSSPPRVRETPRPSARHGANSVFEESARRVRSLQGIENFPPGTIQLTPPAEVPAGAPSAPPP